MLAELENKDDHETISRLEPCPLESTYEVGDWNEEERVACVCNTSEGVIPEDVRTIPRLIFVDHTKQRMQRGYRRHHRP